MYVAKQLFEDICKKKYSFYCKKLSPIFLVEDIDVLNRKKNLMHSIKLK